MRRIMVCVDGTWQDADFQPDPDLLTNISRISRALLLRDSRTTPPVEQVRLYIAGLGSGEESLLGAVHGALGTGLLARVREVYDFICLNYEVGDEITLVGFSRGAYVVRLASTLIGLIGVLPPAKMHRFPAIFDALCRRGQHPESADDLQRLLVENEADRQAQLSALAGQFLVKAVLVFDTVPIKNKDDKHFRAEPGLPIRFNAFGLPADKLEPHIEIALQALALDEDRAAYVPLLWRQDPTRPAPGQFLLQMYFSGVHTDVGGGYKEHDLGDLSLMWAVSHLKKLAGLVFDMEYLAGVTAHPTAPYGQMQPHHGVAFTKGHPRPLPKKPSPYTHDFIHDSVRAQLPEHLSPLALNRLHIHSLFLPLRKLEQAVEDNWSYRASEHPIRQKRERRGSLGGLVSSVEKRVQAVRDFEKHEVMKFSGAGDAFKQARAR